MNIPDRTTFITSNPNLTFYNKECFESFLQDKEPNCWPSIIIAIPDEDTDPIRVSVSLKWHPSEDLDFTYEKV